MQTIKKIARFIASMRFAIILLVALAVACSLASLVPQGEDYARYAERYSERAAAAIMALHLDDAFHSPWFIAITAFLCVNLLCCNLVRAPGIWRRMRAMADPARAEGLEGDACAERVSDPEAAFRRLRMPKPVQWRASDGREGLFSCRNRAGLWGAWVCHLGIMLLITGFGLGQMTQQKYTVYGVPGQTKPVGDTGYALAIDDFRVGLRADDTVEQYTADITVYPEADGREAGRSAEISVNNPATLYGMKFYQNSTGWAATVRVEKSGEPLQTETLCAGEYLRVADRPELAVYFSAFYPDYVLLPGKGPATASGALNNPAYLYQLYYNDQLLGMNALMAGERVTIDDYVVTFSEPRSYTLIQIKRDVFTPLALIGGLTALIGLALALYAQPARVWAIRGDEGWTVRGACPKGGAIFRDRFIRACSEGHDDASS